MVFVFAVSTGAAASRGFEELWFEGGWDPSSTFLGPVGVQSSALFDISWAAAPHEIGRLLFVPRLKLLLVDGGFERSFKRKEASREAPVFAN